MEYCQYYQAYVDRSKTWFFTATLRAHEHLAFDRTVDAQKGLFEFFVPINNESVFLKLMAIFQDLGIIKELNKLENRLKE